MNRRKFFTRLLSSLGIIAAAPGIADAKRPVLVQESSVAGFQFHSGEMIWPSLNVGARLKLVRESSNPNDDNAVAVYFQNEQLGYVPRSQNAAIAQMLDRGESLEARIERLSVDEDPWSRIRISISLA